MEQLLVKNENEDDSRTAAKQYLLSKWCFGLAVAGAPTAQASRLFPVNKLRRGFLLVTVRWVVPARIVLPGSTMLCKIQGYDVCLVLYLAFHPLHGKKRVELRNSWHTRTGTSGRQTGQLPRTVVWRQCSESMASRKTSQILSELPESCGTGARRCRHMAPNLWYHHRNEAGRVNSQRREVEPE